MSESGLLPADINRFIGGQVSGCQRCGFEPRRWPSLRFWLFDVCTLETLSFQLAVLMKLTLTSRSYCRRHRTMGSRCKTFLVTGLTCHPFLEHSLLISGRVSTFVPFLCISVLIPLGVWRISTAGLEMVTYGLTRATSHRVLSPPAGSTPRYSIPFFQNISQNLRLNEIRLDCMYCAFGLQPMDLMNARVVAVPPEVLGLREKRGGVGETDCGCRVPLMSATLTHSLQTAVNYGEYGHEYSGHVSLIGRIK